MSNSSMVCYTRISPNKSSRNGRAITKITPHHMSGNLSIETCGSVFAPTSRQASSNYGIGTDGRVGMYVEENDRAWTSSSYENDSRAVTIEVANSQLGGDWPVSDAAWNSLVNLCVDICRRNGIPKLVWTGDSSGTLTMHKMFAATDCPGTYLQRRMPELANQVNAILAGTQSAPAAPSGSNTSGNGTTTSTSGASSGAHTQAGFGGTYTCMVDKLNVRSKPSMSGSVVASYTKGQTVNLEDNYYIADGYVWGTYIANSGNRRYIAVGKHTGKAEADDYLIKGGKVSSSTSNSSGGSKPSSSTKTIPSGRYKVVASSLNVRSAPSMSGSKVASYSKGEYINSIGYDAKIADGYIWAHYTSYSGATRWVAVGKADGSDTYLVKA